MSGETQDSVSGWTTDTLHTYMRTEIQRARETAEARDLAIERAVELAMDAAEKAVLKAERAAAERFEAHNEFRGQLTDQAATFISRAEAVAIINALAEKVADHADRLNRSEGSSEGSQLTRSGFFLMVGGAVGVLSIIILSINLALAGGT